MRILGTVCIAVVMVSVFAMVTPQAAAGSNRVSCGLATGTYPVTSYPHLAALANCLKQATFAPVSGVKLNWVFGYPNQTLIPISRTGDYPGIGFVDSLQPTTNSTGQASIYARNEGALSGPSQVLMCDQPQSTHSIGCAFFQ